VRSFIGSTSVWHDVAPALERVTRHCNLHSEAYARPILHAGPTGGAALTAETAFRLAALGQRDIDDEMIAEAVAAAAAFLRLPAPDTPDLNMHEVEELRQNLLLYFSPLDDFQFLPTVPGVGVLDATAADVRRGPTLYEVKTVTRGWHSSDLRQCLTYAAMLYSVGDRIADVALVNPRTGRVSELSLSQIAVGAGADSAPDLLNGLIYRMVALEVSA
jgi:hypothetical protein